ncbi:hypothetical protein KQH82_02980 [bacterium]|nr:hypothetical protein [bacterium]
MLSLKMIRSSLVLLATLTLLMLPLASLAAERGEVTKEPAKVTKTTAKDDRAAVTPSTGQDQAATEAVEQPSDQPSVVNVTDGDAADGSVESSKAGEQVNWKVLGAGGGSISSTNYRVSGTLGQTVIGLTESTNYKVRQGYWSAFARGEICCVGSTGDVNDDGSIDLSDLLWLVNYSFLGGPAPSCLATANVNGSLDCEVNLSDLLWLVNYSFLGGPAPAECLESCQ